MQEAFLAAVNKSRQRQPIKGCSVCGQQGHTEQSLLLVETEPSQCAAAGAQSTRYPSCTTISTLSSSEKALGLMVTNRYILNFLLFTKGALENHVKESNQNLKEYRNGKYEKNQRQKYEM
ncbi:hypothetical protein P7K49_031419 [Saguinus oedipus]|uniref:Uncharacterized protein n=1 Tax=Saguinus oedipus TaxID=9490 RepID=A0ABQ9TZD0_SAGOE|nr:hypothetical protein P7K49_031419 [Saguinus oedipus]